MGFASGSNIFESFWDITREYVPDEKKVEVCQKIILILQKMDWDTEGDFINSSKYPEFNEALNLAEEHWNRRYNRFNTHEDDV